MQPRGAARLAERERTSGLLLTHGRASRTLGGRLLLEECRGVLKPAGVLRLVLPNLETLVEHYQKITAAGDTRAADEFMAFMYASPRTRASRA